MGGGRLPATAKHRSVKSPAIIIAVAFAAAGLVVAAFALTETRQQVNIVRVMRLCSTRHKEREREKGETVTSGGDDFDAPLLFAVIFMDVAFVAVSRQDVKGATLSLHRVGSALNLNIETKNPLNPNLGSEEAL